MKTNTKKVKKSRKQRKTRFHRKNRKLQKLFSILEKYRQNASKHHMIGGGLFGLSKEEKAAKEANIKAISTLQGQDNFNFNTKTTIDTPPPTDQQKLVAHKDLKSAFEKSEGAKLTKEIEYQRTYNKLNSVAQVSGKAGVAFLVANATVGLLAASGVGLPAAGGIAVCMIIISKIMKKFKELKELQIIMLDMNIILTNCYYLENMINKVLTIFQIYINDMTSDKKYFRKIITVDEYTNLNNPCKNIKQLVEENKTPVEPNSVVNNSNYSNFKEKTKKLKGYNLDERIQNAKQLYINNNDIDLVINAETAEYEAFETALDIDNNDNYINIDDDDALESLMKYMVYNRIKKVLTSCPKNEVISTTNNNMSNKDVNDFVNVAISQTSTTNNSVSNSISQNGGGSNEKMYDKESKYIYQIGVNPDIKFRIKQKLNIIRDLLIEIDPSSAQDTMKSVELNESLDKVEEDAFNKLPNKSDLDAVIKYTIPTKKILPGYKEGFAFSYDPSNVTIKTETDLNMVLETNSKITWKLTDKKKLDTTNEITINNLLNYWLRIKQYTNNPNQLNDFLTLYKQEWTQFLKKCFLKIEYYKSREAFKNQKTPKTDDEEKESYANYEKWVRYYLRSKTQKKTNYFGKMFTNKDNGVANATNFLSSKDKTNMLMNTMNLLNAMFIIMNSQFVTTIKEYERALTTDTYDDNGTQVNGLDRIMKLCQSTVAYQKFLLPPDFSEDKKAILDQVEVSDLTGTVSQTTTLDDNDNDKDNNGTRSASTTP